MVGSDRVMWKKTKHKHPAGTFVKVEGRIHGEEKVKRRSWKEGMGGVRWVKADNTNSLSLMHVMSLCLCISVPRLPGAVRTRTTWC